MTTLRTPRAPGIAVRLLETFLPADSREIVIGDLVETFEAEAARRPIAARLRFWRETFGALLPLQFAPPSVSAYNTPSLETHVQSFIADLRFAVRALARARGFTLLCTLTLGLAIGATAAIFSVANPLLLAPLPYPDANRLVTVWDRDPGGGTSRTTYATYLDLRHDAKTLERSAMLANWDVTIFGEQDAERMQGSRVTWEFFRTLGARPMLGRDFLESDDTPDNSNVVILSYGLWARRFGSDSSVLGRSIDVNGVRRTIIGVMPADFENVLMPTDQIWRPLGYAPGGDSACRTCHHLVMLARVKAGVSQAAAAQETNALPGIFFQKANADVELDGGNGLDAVEPDAIHALGHGKHMGRAHTGRPQALMRIPERLIDYRNSCGHLFGHAHRVGSRISRGRGNNE